MNRVTDIKEKLTARERIETLLDKNSFVELDKQIDNLFHDVEESVEALLVGPGNSYTVYTGITGNMCRLTYLAELTQTEQEIIVIIVNLVTLKELVDKEDDRLVGSILEQNDTLAVSSALVTKALPELVVGRHILSIYHRNGIKNLCG